MSTVSADMDFDTFERISALDLGSQDDQDASAGLFGTFKELNSGKIADLDIQLITKLRSQHPELIVT